jgi:hypothetical protein
MTPVAATQAANTGLTDWLVAIGGLGAFLATIALACLAFRQMGKLDRQADAVREAARAQLQPLVFAQGVGVSKRDAEGNSTFYYVIRNDGVGPALDVEHGIMLGEERRPFGGGESGMRFRTLAAGEQVPGPRPENAPLDYTGPEPLSVEGPWQERAFAFWARFDNVFGERFETVNGMDPTIPAEFCRVLPS